MKEINISDVLSQGWELTKKHWVTILVCLIGITIVQYLISAIFGVEQSAEMITKMQRLSQPNADPAEVIATLVEFYSNMIPMAIVNNIIRFILMVGTCQLLLNCARGNGEFTLAAWNQPIGLYIRLLIVGIIVSIVVAFGFACCILPGIYLYARLNYVSYYMLDHKEAGILEAISASWNMTSNSAFTLSLLLIVFVLIGILGFACCCVGYIVAAIIIFFADVVCYLTLCPKSEE